MCGIAAIFNWGEDREVLLKIKEMTDIVRHRGPDDEGFAMLSNKPEEIEFLGGKDAPQKCLSSGLSYAPKKNSSRDSLNNSYGVLGHRRLSILDLTPAGHQPMCSEDGRYVIIHNGEIYNYLELRRKLEEVNFRFVSHSDTEVILYSYMAWGKNCLNRFNGMFALLIFDRLDKKVFAARDRFGVKPIYYWYSPKGFLAFASEIKQFTVLPGWRAVLNGRRAYDFLNLELSDHTNETFFDGVYQLRGGEYIEATLESLKHDIPVERWYEPAPRPFSGDLREASRYLRGLLTESVSLRLRADVPIANSLSGGLDSSSITCLANGLMRRERPQMSQESFSIYPAIESYDQREFIDEIVKKTNIKPHSAHPPFDELFGNLDFLTWHQDEPFLSSSIYAEWHLYKLAKDKGFRVILDGHGGDELLAGYYGFLKPYFMELFRKRRYLALLSEIAAVRRLHKLSNIALLLRRPDRKKSASPPWLNTRLLGMDGFNAGAASRWDAGTINALSLSQLIFTTMPSQLHWTDRNSMAHSVESRAPFMDYRVAEFLLGLPGEYKLSKGVRKKVLREAMEGVLPEKVRLRADKIGFVAPEQIWVQKRCPVIFQEAVGKAVEQSNGILKPEVIPMADRIIEGKKPFSFFVWRLISFGKWMERFGVDTERPR